MYELIQAGSNTYYIDCPSRIGVYHMGDGQVCLIDSGNDKDAGKKAHGIIEAQGWTLTMIVNTHFHADHVGGNHLLQQRWGCPIYAPGLEQAFVQHTILEPSFLFAGYPCKELRNKFLMATPSQCQLLAPEILPHGMEIIPLDGHSPAMVGFHTDDDICFLADSLTGSRVLEKYHITYLFDVQKHLDTLDRVESLSARLFVPSHADPEEDIRALAQLNRQKTLEVLELILELCETPLALEDLLQQIFLRCGLSMNFSQYVLVGSTVRSCLSYLHDGGRLSVVYQDCKLLWKTTV